MRCKASVLTTLSTHSSSVYNKLVATAHKHTRYNAAIDLYNDSCKLIASNLDTNQLATRTLVTFVASFRVLCNDCILNSVPQFTPYSPYLFKSICSPPGMLYSSICEYKHTLQSNDFGVKFNVVITKIGDLCKRHLFQVLHRVYHLWIAQAIVGQLGYQLREEG